MQARDGSQFRIGVKAAADMYDERPIGALEENMIGDALSHGGILDALGCKPVGQPIGVRWAVDPHGSGKETEVLRFIDVDVARYEFEPGHCL